VKIINDLLAAVYFLGLLTLAVFVFPDQFKQVTGMHPYLMGFVKVALLATFGEYLKRRLMTGKWQFDSLGIFSFRVLIWGLFGLWFTMAFPLFSFGVDQCIAKDLWPDGPALWVAFSKSLWINLLGLYGWTMMLTHEWMNFSIAAKKIVSLREFGEKVDKSIWFGKIPGTIIYFWLPAHTITFILPGVWRILMAATLSVVLGFLLTAKKK
jgi:hypothetical protein